MKKILIAASVILVLTGSLFAQKTENFDLVSYSPPVGWQKTGNSNAVFFTTEDKTKGVYCAITLFRAFPADADSKKNFNAAWSSLVADSFKLLSAPQMSAPGVDHGWTIESGVAAYEKDGGGGKGVLMLITASGGGKMVNVMVLTNTDVYQNQVSIFVGSLKLPPVTANQNTTRPAELPPSQQPPPAQNNSSSNNSSGITKASTTFSDGWTAAVQPEYVSVTKGNLLVLVMYPVSLTDQIRQIGIGEYFWRADVQAMFNAAIQPVKRDDVSGIDFAEGAAIDKQTGKSVFVAMSVLKQNGVAKVVIAAAPDRQTYYNQFPRPDNLAAMAASSNRFAVTAADLSGNWDGANSASALLENIYTGQSAGMTATSISDQFFFGPNGAYTSRHKAATGMVGSQKFSDIQLNGRFQTSDWEITLTNRENGKTSTFSAYFEAVKGGKILHLTDKQYSSMQYHLFRAK